ncbi:fibroblast growth factor 1-like isoform X2 [Dendronephthya gigantea]|uniref:fibroblast growth factor 1-like isoform X2 n=1 Tax=Dendronephthya gigantea TaxID=151771 RepID=UPI00106A04F1|nr:fibroblast growth factor 1-like isoform X2 [Dendronephthya gigantea]
MYKVLCIFGVVLVCLNTFTVVKTSPTNRRISNSLQRRLKRNLTNLAKAFNLSQGFAGSPRRSKVKKYRLKDRSTALLNGLIDRSLVKAPSTNTRKVMLFSRNGYLLQISNNGFVNGTHDMSDNVWFELQSVHVGIVRIKNIKTGRYLAMEENNGRLRGHTRLSLKTLFVTHEVKTYHWYRSYTNSNWYVGIRKNGTQKPAHQTAADQKAVLFFLVPFST